MVNYSVARLVWKLANINVDAATSFTQLFVN